MRRALRTALMAIVACSVCCGARAQVFEISGGNSSLYQAGGGSVSMHGAGSDMTIGAGMFDGHFGYGARMDKQVGKSVYTAGDEQLNFLLPTDIFDPSHYLFARGMGYQTQRDGLNIVAFGGTNSTMDETPIFEAANFGEGMGFFSIRKAITPKWTLWSDTVASGKMTEITAVQWEPARKFALAAAAGAGANEPYGAASLNLSRRWADVLGSYISAGQNFRRVVVSSPIQAEPYKGNLLVTVRPTQFLSLSGGTQSFLVPSLDTNQNVSSSVRTASSTLAVAGASLSASVYNSSALGETTNAAAFTASRDVTHWVRLMSNYMVTKPKDSTATSILFTTITENLNQHFSVNESIDNSGGQTSLLYGGSLLTNFVTISANYENFYVPVDTTSPFQESLMLDVSLHLFGRATLHGATFVSPTGKTLYTTTADAVAVRGESTASEGEQIFIGNSVLRVQVVDADNRPVDGAALMIDGKEVFTDETGIFVMREHRPRKHTLKVMTLLFLDGGHWEVMSAPEIIRSSNREDDPGAVVVVRRIPAPAANGTAIGQLPGAQP
jgi:hypothetical protein